MHSLHKTNVPWGVGEGKNKSIGKKKKKKNSLGGERESTPKKTLQKKNLLTI